MWLPAWVGRIYARLLSRFQGEPFGIRDVAEETSLERAQARNAVSLLRRRGFLVVWGRQGRWRRYRLLDPSTVLYARGWGVVGYENLPGVYTPLLLAYLRAVLEAHGPALRTAVLYGSVARGEASPGSDVDLLFVVDGLPSGYLDRVTSWSRLETREDVVAEKRRLRQAGRGAELSWILLSPEEARRLRLLYLDMCQEGVLLLDREGFFARILEGVRREMERAEARRHPAEAGWYWTFRRDLRVGAEVG